MHIIQTTCANCACLINVQVADDIAGSVNFDCPDCGTSGQVEPAVPDRQISSADPIPSLRPRRRIWWRWAVAGLLATLVFCALVGASVVTEARTARSVANRAEERVASLESKLTAIDAAAGRTDAAVAAVQRLGAVHGKVINDELLHAKRRPITLNKSGSEICGENGEECIAVSASKAWDRHGTFLGYQSFGCNARVAPHALCMVTDDGLRSDFKISPGTFRRASTSPAGIYVSAATVNHPPRAEFGLRDGTGIRPQTRDHPLA